jgi:DNA repair photolyase
LDVLQDLQSTAGCRVALSIPFARDELARAIEPYASPPSKRFESIRILSDAGIDTAVAVAPIIPGLNDEQVPEILTRACEAGARSAFKIMLRLPREVGPIFEERLAEALPLRRSKVMNAIRDARGGASSDARFGSRMLGKGPRWSLIEQLFASHCDRLGLDHLSGETPPAPPPRQPSKCPQLPLIF